MKNFLYRCIHWMFHIIFAIVLFILIFLHIYTKFSFHFLISNFVLFLLGCGLLFVWKKMGKKGRLKYSKILFLLFVFLLFLFELLMTMGILFRPGWDAGMLIHSAYDSVLNKTFGTNKYYFEIYPNNLLLLFYEMVVALFAQFIGKGIFTFNFILVFINIIIFMISGVLVYFCIKKITRHDKLSLFGFFIYIVLVGSSGWVLVPYTDSIGVFFPILFLFILLYWKKNQFLKFILICLLSFLAFHIKPQLFIIFIAFILVSFIELVHEKKFKEIFKYLFVIVGCYLVVSFGYSLFENKMNLDSEKSFGMTHFLMMGFNYEQCGVYNEDDVNFSRNIVDSDIRRKENLKVVESRIQEYGPLKLMKHFRNKILVNFDDGTFFFGGEGHFYEYIYSQNVDGLQFLKEFIYSDGKYYQVVSTIRQFFWIFVLMLLPMRLFKKDTQEMLIIKLSLIGLFLFELLFEARSRYLFCYVPIFIVIACYHLYGLKGDK